MSSSMVTDNAINSIITKIAMDERVQQFLCERAENGDGTVPVYDFSDEAELARLGHDLFAMNIRGVDARYGLYQAQEFRALDYRCYAWHVNNFTSASCLSSLLYQCAEGAVPDEPLYKLMDALGDYLFCLLYAELRPEVSSAHIASLPSKQVRYFVRTSKQWENAPFV